MTRLALSESRIQYHAFRINRIALSESRFQCHAFRITRITLSESRFQFHAFRITSITPPESHWAGVVQAESRFQNHQYHASRISLGWRRAGRITLSESLESRFRNHDSLVQSLAARRDSTRQLPKKARSSTTMAHLSLQHMDDG